MTCCPADAETVLQLLVDEGHLEPAGHADDGKPMFVVTDAGRAWARKSMRARGLLGGGS